MDEHLKLLEEFLVAMEVYSESGFDDGLQKLEDKVKDVISKK